MHKSIYSLVLSDGVVEAIDRMAYRNGHNRSQMINEILAEYVSYVTPEQRIREVFRKMSTMLEDGASFRLIAPPSDSLISLGSALVYKYNPTVRYSVELFRGTGNGFGELRVSLRTQNAMLVRTLNCFYALWDAIEKRYLGVTESRREDGRFFRPFCLHENTAHKETPPTPVVLGELIVGYIRVFDAALKLYFKLSDDPQRAAPEIEQLYAAYLLGADAII